MQTSTQNKEKEKKIGNYILGKTIGEGTFGKVKLASHTLTGEKVAIKILVKEKIIDVADVQRVSREIHILKLIRHPSIIQLYEIIETSKHLFLVMEYIENGELFDYIVKNTKLEEEVACRFFKNIISGVNYLHELNIVHRDLKPQNLLIDWKKGLKIVDFGLSNTYKQGQLLKTACGSPCYAAPEMISSKKYNGLQVDIWSCGVILFAMVCGYLPFEDSNTSQLYKKILSGEYILPNFVSEEFKDLLQNILAVNPSKRYRVSQIFQHPWCKQVEDIPLMSGIIVGYHRIPVDRQILSKLQEYQFDLEYAQRCIEANKHNHITTTYHLLLKKYLKAGQESSADISSPTFDYKNIQPFKRVNNEKKHVFFGNREENALININNTDIKLTKKLHSSQYMSAKHNQQSQNSKINVNTNNRSNNFFQRENKEKVDLSSTANNPKKYNDLRMYLKPNSKKKDFYSEAKRRQLRRNQAQSLHFDSHSRDREDQRLIIRTNTEYNEQIPSGISKYQHPKTKFHKLRNQNRITFKNVKERPL